jgi:hypothetical protein
LTDGLYYSPGRKGTADYNAELYVYDGVTSTLVWSGPPYVVDVDRWAITYLYRYNNNLLIFMANTSGDQECRIYEFNPSTGTAILRVSSYIPYEPDYGGSGVFGVAECGSELLLHHGANYMPSVLMSLNPSDWTLTFIQRVADYSDAIGGIVKSTDGYYYWNTGRYIYSSATGAAGSFSELYDMASAYDDWVMSNGLVLHSDGYTYCGGSYWASDEDIRARIYKIKDNAVTVDYDVSSPYQTGPLSALISMGSDLLVVPHSDNVLIKSGGTWSTDTNFVGFTIPTAGAYYSGKAYWGSYNQGSAPLFVRRDSAGTLSTVASYSGYIPFFAYWDCFPMAIASILPTRRPRIQFIRIGR